MKAHVIEGKTSTPFGWVDNDKIMQLRRVAGLNLKNGVWSIVKEKVTFDMKVKNFKGQEEEKTMTRWIAIRTYNFEYNLLKYKSIDKALSLTNDSYLPTQLGFNSYSQLLSSVQGERDTEANKDLAAQYDAILQSWEN